jgi:hypothetical protein
MNAPKTSIRQLSQQINHFVGLTHTTLYKNLHLYPYRVEFTSLSLPYYNSEEIEADYARRLHLCNWLVDNVDNNVLVCI